MFFPTLLSSFSTIFFANPPSLVTPQLLQAWHHKGTTGHVSEWLHLLRHQIWIPHHGHQAQHPRQRSFALSGEFVESVAIYWCILYTAGISCTPLEGPFGHEFPVFAWIVKLLIFHTNLQTCGSLLHPSFWEARTPRSARRSQSRSDAGFEGAVTKSFAVGWSFSNSATVWTRVVVLPVPGGPHNKGATWGTWWCQQTAFMNSHCCLFNDTLPCGICQKLGRWRGMLLSRLSLFMLGSSMALCILRNGVRVKLKCTLKGGLFLKVWWNETLMLSKRTLCAKPQNLPWEQVSKTLSPWRTLGLFSASPGTSISYKSPFLSSGSSSIRS